MKVIALIICVLANHNCAPEIDRRAEEEALLRLNDEAKLAHFERNADRLTSQFADTIYSVSRGEVRVTALSQSKARYKSYFEKIRQLAWQDRSAPVITISNDATLATMIVKKFIVIGDADSIDASPDTSYFAWTAVFKKFNGQWKMISNTSTNAE